MKRKECARLWLTAIIGSEKFTMQPASADASFRSYLRVATNSQSYILMDAPPQHEDCKPFIHVNYLLSQGKINVPDIIAKNLEQGFLLLEDFGSILYLDTLNQQNVDKLYTQAMNKIHLMQGKVSLEKLPDYDNNLLMKEMQLFSDWFIKKHLGEEITKENQLCLDSLFEKLVQNALEQPQSFVHRDYHSRNLMLTKHDSPGVIDFQDAVVGPVTYDLVSLLKDCYIQWPPHQVKQWVNEFRLEFNAIHNSNHSQQQWQQWFDLMGVQRHLKAIGIFCRLNYRDNKADYLKDIPRTLNYVIEVANKYTELKELTYLIKRLIPKVIKS